MDTITEQITSVELIAEDDDDYVYDIVMEDSDHPYFFGNDILAHNSVYFKTLKTNKVDAVQRADEIADIINDSFPAFMRATFMCSSEAYDSLIKAGREIVGLRGLFLDAKKKYTIRVVDIEGLDVFKLKMMGSELKKVDTPKVIQDFLKGLMEIVLDTDEVDEKGVLKEVRLQKYVNKSRRDLIFKIENPIVLGASKGINNLDQYYAEYLRTEKLGKGNCRLPGHVRAAINYNEMVSELDPTAKLLKSGDKGLIFYLKPNGYNLKSIAIPGDFEQFPSWFAENFELDLKRSESNMIQSKIEGIYDALGYEIPTEATAIANKVLKF